MDKLVLIDGNSLINRAFYAIGPLSDKNGQPTNAVFGFTNMLIKVISDIKPKYMKLHKEYSGNVIRLGMPSGLTQAIMSLAMIIVQSLTNSFGEAFIAANVIVMRVDGFAMLPNMSFGTAMTTYTGQNVGAKKMDRVKKMLSK